MPPAAEDFHPAGPGAHSSAVVAVRIHVVAAAGWDKVVAEIGHIVAVEADNPAAAGTVLGVVGSLEADLGEHHSFVVEAAVADYSMVAGWGPDRIGYLLGKRPDSEHRVPEAVGRNPVHPGYRMKSRWRPSTFSVPGASQ